VNANDQHSIFSSLSHAIEILDRNRTPDPDFIAAYDTLKQSRAMLARALAATETTASVNDERVAA
jgi:hypothetical protein